MFMDRYTRDCLDAYLTASADAAAAPLVSPVCDHAHDGPHVVLWAACWHGTRRRGHEVLTAALPHALDADEADRDLVETLLDRARFPQPSARYGEVELTDEEYRAAERVFVDAAEYMIDNHYVEDDDPDVVETAALLGDGSVALVCWADRLPERSA